MFSVRAWEISHFELLINCGCNLILNNLRTKLTQTRVVLAAKGVPLSINTHNRLFLHFVSITSYYLRQHWCCVSIKEYVHTSCVSFYLITFMYVYLNLSFIPGITGEVIAIPVFLIRLYCVCLEYHDDQCM